MNARSRLAVWLFTALAVVVLLGLALSPTPLSFLLPAGGGGPDVSFLGAAPGRGPQFCRFAPGQRAGQCPAVGDRDGSAGRGDDRGTTRDRGPADHRATFPAPGGREG